MTSLIAVTSKEGELCFMKIPLMPRRMRSAASWSFSPAVTSRIFPVKSCSTAALTKSPPSRCPRSKSSSTTSTTHCAIIWSAPSTESQCPTSSKSASAARSRPRLSRKRAWSSTSSMRITRDEMLFMKHFFPGWNGMQHYREAAALGARFECDVASETLHDRTRHVQSQPRCLSIPRKRTKQILRICDPGSGIFEPNDRQVILDVGCYRESLFRCKLHSALTVFCQVQEGLDQTVTIRPHQRQMFVDPPVQLNVRFAVGRFDQYSEFFEEDRQVDNGSFLAAPRSQFHG